MKVALYQPQIPQNTGNVVRTCSVTGTELALIEPLGFSTTNRWLKRAGLDYWEGVKVNSYPTLEALLEETTTPIYFFSSKAKRSYTEVTYTPDDLLIFGSETEGLPAYCHERWPEKCVRIPMCSDARCLNLATSVGIALYEALRQCRFTPLNNSV